MKIQYCSDLHLEFPENLAYMKSNPLEVTGDILILAGDIVPLASIRKYDWFFDWVSDHYKAVYWVPGNHEYYNYSIQDSDLNVHDTIRRNVFLLNNRSVELEEVVIHFTTLWSHIPRQESYVITQRVSDFFLIKYRGENLSVIDFNSFHESAKNFLTVAFEKFGSKKSIVVTHHVPTFINYPEEFKLSELRFAFTTELESFINQGSPEYWIFGHHHINVPDFGIGKTKLVTNQLGYVHEGEERGFVRGKFIDA